MKILKRIWNTVTGHYTRAFDALREDFVEVSLKLEFDRIEIENKFRDTVLAIAKENTKLEFGKGISLEEYHAILQKEIDRIHSLVD